MANRNSTEKDQLNQSSDRLLRVIEYMAGIRLPIRLVDLAENLGMSQATVLRYLRSLCQQGYVYQDEVSGCYAMTWRICQISDSIKVNMSLRAMASPFLNALSNDLNASICLVIPYENGTMYLDFIQKPCMSMTTLIRIGRNAPIHCTGSGKVLLSSYSERRVQEIIDAVGLEAVTPNTITDKQRLLDELAEIRNKGYALDNEECELGVRCVSVPLYDYSGNVAAAISATDDSELMTDARIETILVQLKQAAKQISYRMGCTELPKP